VVNCGFHGLIPANGKMVSGSSPLIYMQAQYTELVLSAVTVTSRGCILLFIWPDCVSSTGPTHRRVSSTGMSFVAPFLRGRDSGAARRQVNQNSAAEPWDA
jgi:hypothetical protein